MDMSYVEWITDMYKAITVQEIQNNYCQYLIVYLSYSLVVKKLHVYMLIDDACIYERICINCTVTISTSI